jgi:hypothetical protein
MIVMLTCSPGLLVMKVTQVPTSVPVKNAAFWNDISYCSCKHRWIAGKYRLHHLRVLRLLVTANTAPSSPILVILIMEVIHPSEKTVLTSATQRNIPEHGILHNHCHESLGLTNVQIFIDLEPCVLNVMKWKRISLALGNGLRRHERWNEKWCQRILASKHLGKSMRYRRVIVNQILYLFKYFLNGRNPIIINREQKISRWVHINKRQNYY